MELPIRVRLYSLGVTAEALRANIDCKPEFLKGVGQFRPNFHVLKDVPCEPFCTDRL